MQTTNQTMKITSRRQVSDNVVELGLQTDDGAALDWEPGAHVDLILPSGTVRQYSICGGDGARGQLHVAVLDEPNGRGGSREVHDKLFPGVPVEIRGPRNHFPLVPSDRYLFIAGGIGITPILAMITKLGRVGATPWSLVYGGRTRSSMAYVDELIERRDAAIGVGEVAFVPEDEFGRPDLRAAFSRVDASTLVYACGPEPLLKALETLASELLQPGQLHLERFGAADVAGSAAVDDGALDAFEVEISSTGALLQVTAGDRLIDIVRTVAPQVPFSCEEGYCGSCETGVLAGIPCHRDQVLTADERAENDTMMICVGRSMTPRLTLDL